MCGQGHDLGRAVVAVVLPAEGDLITSHAEEARVGELALATR
jgi:hypothetical protein